MTGLECEYPEGCGSDGLCATCAEASPSCQECVTERVYRLRGKSYIQHSLKVTNHKPTDPDCIFFGVL